LLSGTSEVISGNYRFEEHKTNGELSMLKDRDPMEIAKMIKFMRDAKRMKAETPAELSGLSPRSIERAESGRHSPNEQSLIQIARAFGVTVSVFDPIDDEEFCRKIEEAAARTVFVPTIPFENPATLMAIIGGGDACQHDLSEIQSDDALNAATALVEAFIDTGDIWDDVPLGGRLNLARELIDRAKELLALGYKAQIGTYHARHLAAKKLKFRVKLITFLPKDDPGQYALVTLPDELETLPEDRVVLPPRRDQAPAAGHR
jgi:transcriptional regulator with XRE-family HTH domain